MWDVISFFKERDFLNNNCSTKEKEDEKTLLEQVNGDQKIRRDFYLNEVMAIAADYAAILKKTQSVN